jgi:hypothetical protein
MLNRPYDQPSQALKLAAGENMRHLSFVSAALLAGSLLATQPGLAQTARKCGAEWKEAKAANRTAGMKWPQFWSRCNARLKGNQA